jgi:hypothetical protein
MTEHERKTPGPFNQRRYSQGFRHAVEDHEEGDTIEEMERHAASMSNRTWYSIGYTTGVNGIKEGRAL